MTKTLIFVLAAFVVLQISLRVISRQCPYGRCARYVEHIADEISEYRHEHGAWPKDAEAIHKLNVLKEGEKLETLYGVELIYNPENYSLSAACAHDGVPFLSWITFVNYLSGCSAHGISLSDHYEELYGD